MEALAAHRPSHTMTVVLPATMSRISLGWNDLGIPAIGAAVVARYGCVLESPPPIDCRCCIRGESDPISAPWRDRRRSLDP